MILLKPQDNGTLSEEKRKASSYLLKVRDRRQCLRRAGDKYE